MDHLAYSSDAVVPLVNNMSVILVIQLISKVGAAARCSEYGHETRIVAAFLHVQNINVSIAATTRNNNQLTIMSRNRPSTIWIYDNRWITANVLLCCGETEGNCIAYTVSWQNFTIILFQLWYLQLTKPRKAACVRWIGSRENDGPFTCQSLEIG